MPEKEVCFLPLSFQNPRESIVLQIKKTWTFGKNSLKIVTQTHHLCFNAHSQGLQP
jgi:hypothetical protein